ncbi:MAG TPA: CBS domain-containing protein [Gemmatimonadaceae bacterium]|nr:CBS domain-containing protein [Gemmatimonadaceae bacterium]
MKAQELMMKRLAVATPDDKLSTAAALMRDESVGIIPVVKDRQSMRLEGVLTDRDVAVRCVAGGHESGCHVRDHMTSDHLATVPPSASVEDVMQLMEREQVRRIPVVADGDRLAGIIAQADIARRIGPVDPVRVERVLERVSQPAELPRIAPKIGAEVNHEVKFAAPA